MMRSIFRKPTYANFVATAALVIAVAGGSAAVAGTLVGAKDVKKVVVRTATSTATTDSDGTQNGAAAAVATATATAECNKGEKLLGGGARWATGNDGNDENLYINESYRVGKTWTAEGIVDFGAQGSATLVAEAYCLKK